MQKRFYKYFWDTGASTGNNPDDLPPKFRLRRILEHTSFPDMLNYPFEEVQEYLPSLDIKRLRTGEHRKMMLEYILPYLQESLTWEEAVMKMVNERLKKIKWAL